MDNDNMTAVRPKPGRMVRASSARAIARRMAARKAYRAKIESLLDESRDERLADMWQQVCPFAIDPAYQLSDRRRIIADLTDFAETLQPNVDGMKADQLGRLIEKYATATMIFSLMAA